MNNNNKCSFVGAGIALALAVILTILTGFRGFLSILFCSFALGLGGTIGASIGKQESSKKKLKSIGIYSGCFLIIICLFVLSIQIFVVNPEKAKEERIRKHHEILNKDPNTWTEEEKDYVNSYIELLTEEKKKNK